MAKGSKKGSTNVKGSDNVTQDTEAPAGEASATVETKAPKSRGPRGVPETAVISLLATTNPKRPGSRAHTLWGLYRDGMTVAEFANACEAAGIGKEATPALVYDAAHKFISIEGYTPGKFFEAKPAAPKKEKAPKKTSVKGSDAAVGDAEQEAEQQAETVD